MRWLCAIAALVMVALSSADVLVDIPLGRKLLERGIRGRASSKVGGTWQEVRLGTGVAQSYEVDLGLHRRQGGDWRGTFDVSYNVSPPITDIAPGVSVGVQDLLAVGTHGRAAYLAMTQRIGNVGELNQDVPTEVTIGVWSRRDGLFFVGASLPFSRNFVVVGEATGSGVVAGIELRAGTAIRARWLAERSGQRLHLLAAFRI